MVCLTPFSLLDAIIETWPGEGCVGRCSFLRLHDRQRCNLNILAHMSYAWLQMRVQVRGHPAPATHKALALRIGEGPLFLPRSTRLIALFLLDTSRLYSRSAKWPTQLLVRRTRARQIQRVSDLPFVPSWRTNSRKRCTPRDRE